MDDAPKNYASYRAFVNILRVISGGTLRAKRTRHSDFAKSGRRISLEILRYKAAQDDELNDKY